MRLLRPETRVSDLGCHVGIMWMFPKIVVPPNSNHPLKNRGFSIILTIHFGGFPPNFWRNTHVEEKYGF